MFYVAILGAGCHLKDTIDHKQKSTYVQRHSETPWKHLLKVHMFPLRIHWYDYNVKVAFICLM